MKASIKGHIEGDTKEERTAYWFKHVKGLICNLPDIEDVFIICKKIDFIFWSC